MYCGSQAATGLYGRYIPLEASVLEKGRLKINFHQKTEFFTWKKINVNLSLSATRSCTWILTRSHLRVVLKPVCNFSVHLIPGFCIGFIESLQTKELRRLKNVRETEKSKLSSSCNNCTEHASKDTKFLPSCLRGYFRVSKEVPQAPFQAQNVSSSMFREECYVWLCQSAGI